MRNPRIPFACLLFAAAALASTQQGRASSLMVGDPAPSLSVSKWVKGTPVKAFEKGKLYVVEFWATWCGPCKVSIPHLTELQKKYKDKVQFVGVSIWESKREDVEPFVAQMGSKMDYTVAIDEVPASDPNGTEGAMAKSWMQAAGQNGIPSAFIVNGDGKVAWIGHPMEMDGPLAKVVDGTWDISKHLASQAAVWANTAEVEKLRKKFSDAIKAKDYNAALAVCDEIEAASARDEAMYTRLAVYTIYKKDYETAERYGRDAVSGVFKDDWNMLNSIAWMVVDPKGKCEKKNLGFALAAAERSVELQRNWANLDTLARAYFIHGEKAKAIELQKEAVSLAPDEDVRKELQAALDEYLK